MGLPLKFSVAIFLSILTERFGGVMIDFVYSDVNFVKLLLSCLRSREGLLLVSSTDYCRSCKALEYLTSLVEVILAYSLMKFFLSSFKLFSSCKKLLTALKNF